MSQTRVCVRGASFTARFICILLCVAGLSFSAEVEQGVSPTIEDLAERIGKAKPVETDAIVSSFIEEHRGDFPLIEDDLVTFVYKGPVAVRANIPSDLNRWDTKAHQMERLGDTDLYYLTLRLPMDARIDYKFYVDGMWMLDPLNDKTVSGGFGPNSAFGMPAYEPPPEIEYIDSLAHGTIETHEFESGIIAGSRQIQVYLPAVYGEQGYKIEGGTDVQTSDRARGEQAGESYQKFPVIFVQDGGEYITLGSMVNVLDYAISREAIPPLVAVFIDPLDRNYEYFLNKDYERMVIEEILFFIRGQYHVSEKPERNAIMGASLGGAISVMIALDYPEVFGKCGSQSGAFEVNDGELVKRVATEPAKPVDFYLDCGTFGDLLESNRLMKEALDEKGYNVIYQEFNQGHSWGNWRAHIDDMLVFFWGKGAK
jgi:enterochelin esterase-like enzyme